MGPFPHHRSSSLYTRVESPNEIAKMIQHDMAPTWHVKWIMFSNPHLGLSQRNGISGKE